MSVLMHGTKVYYAADNVTWVALAAGAYPTTGFTEVTRIVNTKVSVMETSEYDDAPLGATSPDPETEIKPGSMEFTKDKVALETATLRGFCDGSTTKTWCFVYKDGTADTVVGKIFPVDGASAQKGDYKAKIQESYKIQGVTIITHRPPA